METQGIRNDGSFRGPRSMYDERAFEQARPRARDTVMRRAV
jgi:hypothetical protein